MLFHWNDLTTDDFRAIDFAKAVALMPVAATEQHGPHLPVSVDADINAGIVAEAAPYVEADVPVYVLPQLPIGKSDEHSAFPGTLTVGGETLLRMWLDMGASIVRAGFQRLVILNSHGGQPQIMEIAVRELRIRHAILAVAANTYGFGLPEGLFDPAEIAHGIHAGAIETSMMLHLRPDAVRRERFRNFTSIGSQIENNNEVLRLEGSVNVGWMTQDLNPAGAAGDATRAKAEHGALCITHAGRKLAQLLTEVSRYSNPIDQRPDEVGA